MPVHAIHHIQIAMPTAREDDVRRFYGDVMGLVEIPKPESLAGRGGVWFQVGAIQLHLGADPDFRPAAKAHPALVVDDLEAMRRRLEAAGHACQPDVPFMGFERFHVHDPFGNRLELLMPSAG